MNGGVAQSQKQRVEGQALYLEAFNLAILIYQADGDDDNENYHCDYNDDFDYES